MTSEKITIVLPVFNEELGIETLISEIEKHVKQAIQFIFVDDGSTDSTLKKLKNLRLGNDANRKKIVILSRNFGHQVAVMAGLCSVEKDADRIVVMDSDFQDDPGDISALFDRLEEGYDCVYAIRKAASGSLIVNLLTKIFYSIQKRFLSFSMPRNAGTFSIFNRGILDKILEFKESDVYFPGLRAYVGMRQTGVKVKRQKRAYGKSKVGKVGLFHLAMSGLLGFSALPMRLIFGIGSAMTLLFCSIAIVLFFMRIVDITQIPGVTTVLIAMLGLAGIQVMFLGIVGEYVGKLFLESKKRPRWLVSEIVDEE
jgi:polyisoprenyl-phosphate glycosyltransferase